ncbi:MAG: dihydroorotate dehydrogenase [Thermotogae bacterium]|nr:dihydroorotate dehydrogenase [Thermotogota bacterium]
MVDMSIELFGLRFKNSVVLASGPAGNGKEAMEVFDLARLGGFTTKTVTWKPERGNPPPRLVEIYGGVLNSIGLENGGFEYFVDKELPLLRDINTIKIVSVGGETIEEFARMVEILNDIPYVDIIELNLSCPNVESGGVLFGKTSLLVRKICERCKKVSSKKPLIIKLSPDVTDIVEIASEAVKGGIDGFTLINSVQGMKINIEMGTPYFVRAVGGMSGPCIKPIGIWNVYQVRRAFPDIPIIGVGGIMSGEDAIEYIMAGANVIGIGFGAMVDFDLPYRVIDGIEKFLKRHKYNSVKECYVGNKLTQMGTKQEEMLDDEC